MKTKLSVLMSVYNEPIDWLKVTVESILNQTFSDFSYIIVVDNPDNNEAIKVLEKYASKDLRIKIIINEHNMGLVKSLNRGLQYCDAEFVARMDADDIAHVDRFEKQLKYIEEKGYDLIGADYNVFHDDVVERTVKGPYTDEVCKKILRYESCVAHPLWMVRKEVYDNLGGYRDIDSCEDLDFLIRAALSGYRMGNAPYILLEYRNNPNSITHVKAKKQQAITGLLKYNMQRGRIVPMEEYTAFLESDERKEFERKEEKVLSLEAKFKDNSKPIYERFISLCLLMMTSRYRYMKFVRYSVRRWKRNENY